MSNDAEIYKPVTEIDPAIKTDSQLLEMIADRLKMAPMDTGVTDLCVMEGAIGALFVGQYYGLRILRIIHTSKTLRQYEQFLGAKFEDLIPQHGYYIDRSYAWNFVTTTKQLWDLVGRKLKMDPAQKRLLLDTVFQKQ